MLLPAALPTFFGHMLSVKRQPGPAQEGASPARGSPPCPTPMPCVPTPSLRQAGPLTHLCSHSPLWARTKHETKAKAVLVEQMGPLGCRKLLRSLKPAIAGMRSRRRAHR